MHLKVALKEAAESAMANGSAFLWFPQDYALQPTTTTSTRIGFES